MTRLKTSEHEIQCTFVEWCTLNEARIPGLRLGFAVPNGGYRNKATAAKLKAEGVKAGVPDWMCPMPAKILGVQFHGLAIEFKAGSNNLTDGQAAFAKLLTDAGWRVAVCWEVEDAIKTVEGYFNAH